MRVVVLVLMLGSGACRVPTSAIVHTFETVGDVTTFRQCQVMLGWWLQELVDECGMPLRFVVEAKNKSGLCAVYETHGHTFAAGAGAPYLVACMDPSQAVKQNAPSLKQPIHVRGLDAKSVANYHVSAVYGIGSIPAAWEVTAQKSVHDLGSHPAGQAPHAPNEFPEVGTPGPGVSDD